MEARTEQKPLSVTVAILFYSIEVAAVVINAIGYLIGAGIRLDDLRGTFSTAMASSKSAAEVQIAFMLMIVALVGLISIRGLYRLRPWAWRLAIGLLGARLLLGLYAFFSGNGVTFGLFLPVVTVFLLNQREVRRVFKQMETNNAAANVIRQQ
ncbi:MAG: hypothetical protein U0822_21430 [Anaerolineae bacterium]